LFLIWEVGIKAEGIFCENGAKQVVGDLLKKKIPQGLICSPSGGQSKKAPLI